MACKTIKIVSHVITKSVSELKVAQSCLILCDPMDYTVHGILQARILAWVVTPLGEGNDNPFQYSCLDNPMDRGAWWAAVHRVAQSWP